MKSCVRSSLLDTIDLHEIKSINGMDLDLVQLLQDVLLHPDRPITIQRIKFLVVAFYCI
jgi:hypothetical protein